MVDSMKVYRNFLSLRMVLFSYWINFKLKGLEVRLRLDFIYWGWSSGCGLNFQGGLLILFFVVREIISLMLGILYIEEFVGLYREVVQ